jgi:hypothetical protein
VGDGDADGLWLGEALGLGEEVGLLVGFGVGFGVGAGVGCGFEQYGAGAAGPAATFVGAGARYLSPGSVPGGGNIFAPRAAIAFRSGSWIDPRTSKPGWTSGERTTAW